MSETWKNQEFEGSGLQSINVLYNAQRKNTSTGYFLAALFPLGAHQFYLNNTKIALLYIALSLICLMVFLFLTAITIPVIIVTFALVAFDLTQMEKRVNAFNKNLKMNLSMQHSNKPPENYQGHYTDETPLADYIAVKNDEKPKSNKILSFNEQERLLKEMQQQKKSERD